MSLNWSIKGVADMQAIIDDEDEAVVTQVIVFGTMSVGMNSITEANADEFFTRLRMVDETFGPTLIDHGEHRAIRYDEVVRRIGLGTNASPKTKAQFHKWIAESVRMDAERDLASAKREAEAA